MVYRYVWPFVKVGLSLLMAASPWPFPTIGEIRCFHIIAPCFAASSGVVNGTNLERNLSSIPFELSAVKSDRGKAVQR